MKIAILSDSHDRTDHLEQALEIIKERKIETAIHLGDFISPFVFDQIAASGLKWYGVWGNNDGDKLRGLAKASGSIDMSVNPDDIRELELNSRHIFLTHYPSIARIAALSGQYEAVFFGHNHQASMEEVTTSGKFSKVLLANPGETYGMRYGKPSFGIYDTESNSFEHLFLPQ